MAYQRINFTPMISLAPSYATNYFKVDTEANYVSNTVKFDISSCDNSDKFSDNSRKKLKNYIDWFCEQAKYKDTLSVKHRKHIFWKLNMITLTLPYEQHYSDQIIKQKLLNQFLIESKKLWKMNNYIWRGEKQKNGNIHFHILSDVFIPWKECRSTWNRICDKLDLVKLYSLRQKKKYEFGFHATPEELQKFSIHILKKRWREGKKTGWTDPNSVDIHSLKSINNVGAYVTKYLTKKEDEDLKEFEYSQGTPSGIIEILEKKKSDYLSKVQVHGRNWYVSDNIRKYCKNLCFEIKDNIKLLCTSLFSDSDILLNYNQFFSVVKKGVKFFCSKSNYIKSLYNKYISRMKLLLNPPGNYNCLDKILHHKFHTFENISLAPNFIQLNFNFNL
jgi:hypothetical protein